MLKELHRAHPGVVEMKSLARSCIWRDGIDQDIETTAKMCTSCQNICKQPPKATVHAWEWPSQPFTSPFMGRLFLVVVDAHSRWSEIQIMDNITTDVTMDAFTELFSRYGICYTLVSDNGATFVSEKFQKFLKINDIVHKTTSVYKPSTNGLAERMVPSFKVSLKAKKL